MDGSLEPRQLDEGLLHGVLQVGDADEVPAAFGRHHCAVAIDQLRKRGGVLMLRKALDQLGFVHSDPASSRAGVAMPAQNDIAMFTAGPVTAGRAPAPSNARGEAPAASSI